MDQGRHLALSGVHNFRDYGGYAVAGGGQTRRGVLWRSGHHVDANDDDLARIDDLGLRHVFDLRGQGERAQFACRRGPRFAAEVIFYDGETANLAPHMAAGKGTLDVAGAHAALERTYRNLPNRTPLIWMLRRYFAALAEGNGPSLIHCFAGKDRTGMAVALLHHALGVHPDDAMADFLLTNEAGNMEARVAAGAGALRERHGNISDETIRTLMGVHPSYLTAAREALVESHGSVDAFLAQALGVDEAMRAALRRHLVDA